MLSQQATGITGLDLLLCGGMVEGGVYLVLGRPGTGKTTLGNHIAYNAVAGGRSVLYVTVMAESHDRMLRHLSGFDFLDLEQVGAGIHYLSVYDELIEHGLDGVQATLRRVIRERGYSLVVMDGAGVLGLASASDLDYGRFVSDLGVQMSALGCTTVLLEAGGGTPGEHTIASYVDGILVLENHAVGLQDIRYIHLIKVRGVDHIRGRHRFTVSAKGIEVYPRIESILDVSDMTFSQEPGRVSSGVPGMDEMVPGGVLAGSSTLVWGPAGVGKTFFGLQYILEGARKGECGLVASFHHSPFGPAAVPGDLGGQLAPFIESGLVRVFSTNDPELPVDDWVWTLLNHVDEQKPARILIDSISDVSRLRLESHRLSAFYRALMGTLASRGITTVLTAESPDLIGPGVGIPQAELAAMSDNVLLMYYVQILSKLHRILSVFKISGTANDAFAREFSVSGQGIEINLDEANADRILAAASGAGNEVTTR